MQLDNFYCLTINDDRYNYTNNIFQKYGLPQLIKYTGFTNIDKKERCCLFGHMSLVMIARYLKLPYIFIFEDDAYPRKDILEKIEFYIENKPQNCGILIFGRNGEFGEIELYKNYHIVKQRPFGAHAYLVYQNCYDDLIKSFELEKIADIALKGDNFKKYKPYWTNENLFIQKNIDMNCMSKNLLEKHNAKYFYPKNNGTVLGGSLGIFPRPPNNIDWE